MGINKAEQKPSIITVSLTVNVSQGEELTPPYSATDSAPKMHSIMQQSIIYLENLINLTEKFPAHIPSPDKQHDSWR